MASEKNVEKQLKTILAEGAKKLNLSKYTINLNLNVHKGDGFLGEFYKVSITDDETQNTYHLAVKKAPTEKTRREQNDIELIYKNEIWFYTEVAPAFKKFELEYQVDKPFSSIPEHIISSSEAGGELIVFKDITKSGYVLREKDMLLDDEHATEIFKIYGHFHAISFCLKRKKPEEFARLTNPLCDIWKKFSEKDAFQDALKVVVGKAKESLDPTSHAHVIEKFQKYVDNTGVMFQESCLYKGQYFGILHGDCWSNNMMFKYKDALACSKLEAMNLLDFQLIKSGSPIYDLSYFFYTGGSKQLFDNLEQYLDVYHQSFSKAARDLDCDPQELLPRAILTEEWKQYCKFGMLLSIMLTKIKLMSKEEAIKIIDASDKQREETEKPLTFDDIKYDEDLFLKRVRDILIHMHEIDAL